MVAVVVVVVCVVGGVGIVPSVFGKDSKFGMVANGRRDIRAVWCWDTVGSRRSIEGTSCRGASSVVVKCGWITQCQIGCVSVGGGGVLGGEL